MTTKNENPVELTTQEKAEKEAAKMYFELYKHLTTLSSGSIVLICTFLEKFFKTSESLHFLTASLVCFLASIIGSIYVMSHLAIVQKIDQENNQVS
jgi:hypothetical protein